MSDQDPKGKPKYESPAVVRLGRLARGAGADCAAGNGADPGYCEAGNGAAPGYCTAGSNAATYCTDAGVSAVSEACTAGVNPGTACSAGTGPA